MLSAAIESFITVDIIILLYSLYPAYSWLREDVVNDEYYGF
ncbi:hypothetical protein L313_0707 [Acinetobacter haemolyticus CIP 64.3 = MTCC 9819]|nr:hypothetical protein L313_0707 [Acinetobacter haemolyticus CIP 64.3 = MTCC 9819]